MTPDRVHTFTFAAPNATPDAYGGTSDGFVDQFTARAAIRYLRGGETVQAARLRGQQPAVVTIAVGDASVVPTPTWRMTDARTGAVYNIRAVVLTDDAESYEITGEAGVEV